MTTTERCMIHMNDIIYFILVFFFLEGIQRFILFILFYLVFLRVLLDIDIWFAI